MRYYTLKGIIMFTTIHKSMEDVRNYARLIKAIRKEQKIQTVDTSEGRVYEIIINR